MVWLSNLNLKRKIVLRPQSSKDHQQNDGRYGCEMRCSAPGRFGYFVAGIRITPHFRTCLNV